MRTGPTSAQLTRPRATCGACEAAKVPVAPGRPPLPTALIRERRCGVATSRDAAGPGWNAIDLYRLPLGIGGGFVRRSGKLFEAFAARHERRTSCDLYHSALEVRLLGQLFVIEMAPAWSNRSPDRGVVREGPVGARRLGRSRMFRYEVGCWPEGHIDDLAEAVDSPCRLGHSPRTARALLRLCRQVPALTWGRDELGSGEMWNSNSLVAWLLAGTAHDMTAIAPPAGGRAPGWAAGLELARRQQPSGPPAARSSPSNSLKDDGPSPCR